MVKGFKLSKGTLKHTAIRLYLEPIKVLPEVLSQMPPGVLHLHRISDITNRDVFSSKHTVKNGV